MSQVIAVIGANYGDEGKGYMTDYFCAKAAEEGRSVITVLGNGGGQRGHTVETGAGARFVFHHIGSGAIAGADSYFSPDFILNPLIFLRDYKKYRRLSKMEPEKYPFSFELYTAPECRFSTPYDMMANQILENHRGANRHGSVGVGIWETVRRYQKGPGLSVLNMNLLNKEEQTNYLKEIKKYFEERIFEKIQCYPYELEDWKYTWNHPDLIPHFLEDFDRMLHLVSIVPFQELIAYDTIVIENAQGVLLSQHRYHGTNHTTPSYTGAKGIAQLMDKGLRSFADSLTLCYVTRSYLTKHGAGAFPGECSSDEIAPGIFDLTNQPNPFQGRIRYAKLEENELIHRILKDENDLGLYPHDMMISVTHLNEFMPDLSILQKSGKPIYISDGRTREDCRMLRELI